MSDETSVDDLFGDDKKADKPKRKPRAAKPSVTVEDMTDEMLASVAKNDTRKGVRAAAEAEIERRADPSKPERAGDTDMIDNAVNIRRLDWECECGNTNTLDLQRCGKCNKHRFTTN